MGKNTRFLDIGHGFPTLIANSKLMTVKFFPLFAGLILCAGVSCKKSSSGGSGSYHVTATVDGKAETFNVNAIGDKISTQGVTAINIAGDVTSNVTGESITVSISTVQNNPQPIRVGTYSDTSTTFNVVGGYNKSLSESYLAGTGIYQSYSQSMTLNHFKLVITAYDSSSIKGTFSGDFVNTSNIPIVKKSITNGDFYVKVVKF